MDLGPYQARLIETAIAVGTYLLLRSTARSLIRATLVRSVLKSREEKEVGRLINVLLFLVLAVVLAAIWGVEQSEILLFVSSVITVLGVALFAEMSILSNITACLVLFFQHPVKIGDRIRVFDGDNWVEGELMDLFLQALALGDLAGDAVVADDFALGVAVGLGHDFAPDQAALP